LFDQLIEAPVEQALRLDAACVMVNLIFIAEHPHAYQQCIRNVSQVKVECERFGMPLMVETRVMELNRTGGYEPVGDVEKLAPLVRQAIELGVDLVKVDPTDNPDDFGQVVQMAADKPVLVLGGGKTSEEVLLARTSALLRQGARGVLYGRNVFGHPNPGAIIRAIMSIIHQGATPEQALNLLRGTK
jgi:DhnA family fructose-bisphosphate aldolase class Ia